MPGGGNMAFHLAVGRRFRIKGRVPLAPRHTDDFQSTKAREMTPVQAVENATVEVLEVRPRKSNGYPWYRVRTADGTEGWLNCIALVSREIGEVQ